jgi:predicted CXXCH cytochrome family protein
VKQLSTDPARRLRLKAVVAYPAASLALVVSVALALTPFGPSKVMALTASAPPTEPAATASPTAAPTTATPTTAAPTTAGPTTAGPTTAGPTTAATLPLGAVPAPVPGPVPALAPVPAGAPVDHHVLAWIESPELPAYYLPADAPALGASPFQTFRVRFQMHNATAAPITATPRLEYRPEGAADFVVVPDKPVTAIPFHVAREWVPSTGLSGGTMQGPLGGDIPVADFRLAKQGGLAMTGHHSMGANPDQPITLPPASYTEEEFTVSLSIDAKYLTGYELRITDAGTPLTGTAVATIRLGGPPAIVLSPGQHQGVAVAGPKPANATGALYPLLPSPPSAGAATSFSAAPALYSPSSQPYPLVASTLTPAQDGIHGPYSMSTDRCAVCHSGHLAQAPSLLIKSAQSGLCLTCHGSAGLGGAPAAYNDPGVPANDAATRSYYSHDGVGISPTSPTTTSHTQSQLDEFSVLATGGKPNRHSECADCHNPHQVQPAPAANSALTAAGAPWGASGSLNGVSGVSVVNSPVVDSAPAYTFLDGVTNLVTSEYQLCFKCHSGFTTLTSNAGLKPTQYALDKGVEFNPANPSYHPIEAAGKNTTPKMAASLAGTSPYKLWNFTTASTIRCLSCHATSTTLGPTGTSDPTATPGPTPDPTATPPAPGSALPPHTSLNRGILLRNYQDRVLKTAGAAYSSGDFALCYVCHAEEPFANATQPAATNDTNFPYHGLHVSALMPYGAGTDINTPGSGSGNAICAECHFRIHSTTNKVGTQVIDGSRLVNFAPNVQPLAAGGAISWTPQGAPGTGSCTLTCHGYQHNALMY